MADPLFERVVVPVASPEDAAATAAALAPFVASAGGSVTAVNVLEKAGGGIDKASVEQRELNAEETFDTFREGLAETDVPVETSVRYGTDVAEAITEAAHDVDASAIVFTPRGGNRWAKLLTGDVTHHLVEESDVPVLVLPDREEVADG